MSETLTQRSTEIISRQYIRVFPPHEQQTWAVMTKECGMHLWVRPSPPPSDVHGLGWYGGVEIHYANKPEYAYRDEPDNEHCWLLNKPCWHDGSSLWASEVWIPCWLANPDDHEGILSQLEDELRKKIEVAS